MPIDFFMKQTKTKGVLNSEQLAARKGDEESCSKAEENRNNKKSKQSIEELVKENNRRFARDKEK